MHRRVEKWAMEWERNRKKEKKSTEWQTADASHNRKPSQYGGWWQSNTCWPGITGYVCVCALKSHLASDSDTHTHTHTPWGFKSHAHTERERQTQFLQWSSAVQGSERNKEVSEIEKDSASAYCKSKYPCVTVFMAGDSKPAPAVDICGSNVIN